MSDGGDMSAGGGMSMDMDCDQDTFTAMGVEPSVDSGFASGVPSSRGGPSVTSGFASGAPSSRGGPVASAFEGLTAPVSGASATLPLSVDVNGGSTSSQLRASFPPEARDLLSPPIVDPPTTTTNGPQTSNPAGKMQTQAQVRTQTSQSSLSAQTASAATASAGRTATAARPATAAPATAPSGGDDDMATITVKCINGQKVEQRVNTRTTTVASLKQRVQESTGIAEQRQRLMHMGKNMNEGSRTLKSYNVRNGAVVQMAMENCYGG